MTVRPIVRFPDPRLRLPADEVVSFDEELARLAVDLTETLLSVAAIGITGPHIGVARRVVALRPPGDREAPRIYVNPKAIWTSPETARHTEGSVSMPGISEEIERPARLRISFQDLAGGVFTEEADGFLAACHQHEIDQLDGIFWLQRLSALKRERLVKRFQKQVKGR